MKEHHRQYKQKTMELYDSLPKEVRDALKETTCTPEFAWYLLKEFRMMPTAAAEEIYERHWDDLL